jgi:hypothetical protein
MWGVISEGQPQHGLEGFIPLQGLRLEIIRKSKGEVGICV